MTVGEKIRDLRQQREMTLKELAKAAHTSFQTIYKYENGIITNIPLDRIELIAKALDVKPEVLLGWTDTPSPTVHANGNGDLNALREQLRRQPGMRILFDASKNATEQDLLDAAALIENFKRRRDGEL